jgi:hypothetical protein
MPARWSCDTRGPSEETQFATFTPQIATWKYPRATGLFPLGSSKFLPRTPIMSTSFCVDIPIRQFRGNAVFQGHSGLASRRFQPPAEGWETVLLIARANSRSCASAFQAHFDNVSSQTDPRLRTEMGGAFGSSQGCRMIAVLSEESGFWIRLTNQLIRKVAAAMANQSG